MVGDDIFQGTGRNAKTGLWVAAACVIAVLTRPTLAAAKSDRFFKFTSWLWDVLGLKQIITFTAKSVCNLLL